ncbi:RelA/SpoT [Penicillium pulvis]|uniref:RelA/SpoT n=1 Tax=Penicillium pulvis TaxID=1562058 RepID=UPI002546CF59|nr:RelA/SpoT [Penicillium pulvis]KAJ5784304.1 RelA/SpoT [Penicillium pulvis]
MDMSVANQLGISPAEAKDNKRFESADEVGYYFRKRLRTAEQTLENSTVATSETLKRFLESIEIYNRVSLRRFLEQSGLSTSSGSAYTEFKQKYDPLPVNQVLYLIDEEFLVRNDRHATNPYAPPPPAKRIEIMMSAILWADQLYPSCRSLDWKSGFLDFPCVSLMEYLNWLGQINQRKLLAGDEMNDRDEYILERLWHWFETHDQRPIRLSFAMARHGMVRDVLQELGVLRDIIAELGELNNGPQ